MSSPVRLKSRFTPQEIHFSLTTVTAPYADRVAEMPRGNNGVSLVLAAGRALIRRVSYWADLDFRDSAGVQP
jgi:hypothetical protein